MLKKVSKPFLIGLSLFLLISVRFLWIDKFPVGINHDEIDVVLSSKTIYEKGSDISGTSFPLALFYTKTQAGFAGLPSFLMSFYFGKINLNLFNARFIFILLNIATIYLVAYFLFLSSKSKKMFYITIFVGLLNPWLFFYSRSTTEAPWALFFLTLGLVLFYKYPKKTIYSLLSFVLSFYSYQGAKITIPLFVILFYLIECKKDFKKISKLILIFLLAVLPFFYYSFSKNSTFENRRNELIFSHLDNYSTKVDEIRRDSIHSFYSKYYINKYTLLSFDILKKYVNSYSPNFLFVKGDEVVPFQESGLFLLPDIILIFIGLYYLSKFKYKTPIILLLLLGPVANSLNSSLDQNIYRSFMVIPGLIGLISIAIDKKFKNLFCYLIYLAFFIVFIMFFFTRYSISQSENHFLSERVVSEFVKRQSGTSDLEVVVVSKQYKELYLEYLFFSNYKENLKVSFTDDCKFYNTKVMIYDTRDSLCKVDQTKYLAIQNISDTGTIFKLFNSNLCNNESMSVYRQTHLVGDLSIEKLSNQEFCNRWVGTYE